MLNEEQRELKTVVRRWAEDKVAPYAAGVDRDARFPAEMFKSFVDDGWVKLQYPSEYGGDGADSVSCAILVEEIARVCASSSLVATISKLACIPMIYWGSEELKSKYIPMAASGEIQGSYCLSESSAGSDVASMKTKAVRDGDTYILNGIKHWITNAGASDIYTIFAKTDPSAGSKGISCFVVERDWGVKIGKLEEKLGVRGSPTGEVILDEVRVPAANRIGEEGQGFAIAMGTLNRSRPTIGAQAVGIAQGAIDAAVEYVKQREQFGHPIGDFQGVRFMLADMAMKNEAARSLVYQAHELVDSGDAYGELPTVGAMAKCVASDAAMSITVDALQLFGGYGYTKDFPMERYMRDAKITQIYEGTNQIQRVVISKQLLSGR
jgi:alkylation response protein AidB-like acyl-CoA dehydrogenase